MEVNNQMSMSPVASSLPRSSDITHWMSTVTRLTWVLREADWQRWLSNLLLEEILLVQEEDYRGVDKPLIVANGIEQFHALVHPERNKREIRHKIWLWRCPLLQVMASLSSWSGWYVFSRGNRVRWINFIRQSVWAQSTISRLRRWHYTISDSCLNYYLVKSWSKDLLQ